MANLPKRMPEISSKLKLPKHMALSERELPIVARLVRVLRRDTYWLRFFMEWLLHVDAQTGLEDVSIATAEAILNEMKNFQNWTSYFDTLTEKSTVLKAYPGLPWIPAESDCNAVEKAIRKQAESLSLEDQLRSELAEIKRLHSRANVFQDTQKHYIQTIAARMDETLSKNIDNDDD